MPSTSSNIPSGPALGTPSESQVVTHGDLARIAANFHLRVVNLETRYDVLVEILRQRGVLSEEEIDLITSEAMKSLDAAMKGVEYERFTGTPGAGDVSGAGTGAPSAEGDEG